MKRFLATNIAVLLSLATAFACGSEVTHNYYLFSVFPREMLNSIYEERLNEQWRQYVGTADTEPTGGTRTTSWPRPRKAATAK